MSLCRGSQALIPAPLLTSSPLQTLLLSRLLSHLRRTGDQVTLPPDGSSRGAGRGRRGPSCFCLCPVSPLAIALLSALLSRVSELGPPGQPPPYGSNLVQPPASLMQPRPTRIPKSPCLSHYVLCPA